MRRAVLILAAFGLSACAAANDAAGTIARERAKGVVNAVVAERFPGLNAAPITDCVIDAASASEIISIAGASVTGVTQSTAGEVLTIAQRPEAVQCIAQNSITLLG
ncbi:succinate dehydrogenase [Roseovarius sp. LXJ103]|uniref:succinate dehydrogenase n=1 Tax=Roseovarius carneus TaxID=2853164 RepID=UPI000D60B150|nr:succinate dehydrogenase [Roseovarius carneus]MBZ8118052.1 succinate dehydrogenase [Roseovarius carneus]PWE36203.1 succinate dehydrogenase [Pelagicola sp. LXJ1103]